MPTRRRDLIPQTFDTSDPIRLKEDLERLARAVGADLEQLLGGADPRPVASGEPLGADGVYVVEPSTRATQLDLPTLDPESAGAAITLLRTSVGTATVFPVGDQGLSYLPPQIGAYELLWTGQQWLWKRGGRRITRASWAASELLGRPDEPSLGASGTATLAADPQRPGVNVRWFGTTGHDAVRQWIYVPTGVGGNITLRTYNRPSTGPTGYGVVQRHLRARSYTGSGIPSGWHVHTLPALTMASGAYNWRYTEDKVPLSAAGIPGGCRVELVLSRPSAFPYSSPDLNAAWLVESLTVEFEE